MDSVVVESSQTSSDQAEALLVFPCNGNGIEALDCLEPVYRLVGFIDDMKEKQGTGPGGYPVFTRAALEDFADARVLAVPGSPTTFHLRMEIISSLGVTESRFASVVHPTARISRLATVGRNVLIMAGVVVTSNAVVGNHVCILPNTVIHHDVVIGAGSLIGANVTIAGNTVVGENSYIGSGSSVMNGLSVGKGALIGLGSNVIHSVPAGAKVAGNPARQL